MSNKVRVNVEFTTDKSKNPLTTSEFIKHGNQWLSDAMNAATILANSKADKTYVDSELAKKANKSDTDAALSSKADKSALEATNASVSANASNIQGLSTESAALSARMDEFTKLEEGSTTGDAELTDGRVGADGKTYTNIGGAIRGQVTDLKNDLNDRFNGGESSNKIVVSESTTGGYYSGGYNGDEIGTWVTKSGVNQSNWISLDHCNKIKLALPAVVRNSMHQWVFKNSDGVIFSGGYGKNRDVINIDIPIGAIEFSCAYFPTNPAEVFLIYDGIYNDVDYLKDSNKSIYDKVDAITDGNHSENLYNPNSIITGGYYSGGYNNVNIGTWVENSGVCQSNWVTVKGCSKVLVSIPSIVVDSTHQWVFKNNKGAIFSGGYGRSNKKLNYPFMLIIDVPNGAELFSCAFVINSPITIKTIKSGIYSEFETLNSKISGGVSGNENDTTNPYLINAYLSGISNPVGEYTPASNVCQSNWIDVRGCSQVRLVLPNIVSDTTHQWVFRDANGNIISGGSGRSQTHTSYDYPINIDVPSNAHYVSFAYVKTNPAYVYKIFQASNSALNNRYSARKMNCLGDSITYGYIPDSGAQMTNPYPSLLKTALGLAECRNYGISGSQLCHTSNADAYPFSERYVDMSNDADIIAVFGGTNDYGRATYAPLGNINDTSNNTIYGALNVLCNGLINKYPKAFIFFITPLRRADKTGANAGGYTLEDVAKAINDVCYKYSIPVLNLYEKGGFHIENSGFRAYYGGNDKLHPSQAFVTEHLAPMIEQFIRQNI